MIPLSGALPVAHGTLRILNAGGVLATTLGALDSGSIAVSAGDITIDGQASGATFTGISSLALLEDTGKAGNVVVAASGNLSIVAQTSPASTAWSTLEPAAVPPRK